MASVTIRDVRKCYGTLEVLHGVDIDVADGEFVTLVGPSGCGKSTLLRMIAGLENISAGAINIGDRMVNELAPKDRDIAMVFQNYALYPHMTVAQNMGYSMRLRRASKPAIAQAVQEAARILALEPLLERYPKQLSGGQRQRVAMGRAIVRDPKVFLFDEPLSNLDAKLRVQMRAEIKELHQRLQTTIIYVTHDQVEAMTMADRIVVMRDGVVEQIGRPLDLYDHPANTFVAGFIGSPAMNFLEGQVSGGKFQTADGAELPLPALGPAAEGTPITYGIRPEHFRIDANGLAARVQVVEPMGSETQIVVRLGTKDLTCLFRERVAPRPGETLMLSVDPQQVRLFHATTGAALSAAPPPFRQAALETPRIIAASDP